MVNPTALTSVHNENRFEHLQASQLNDVEEQSLLEMALTVLQGKHQRGVQLPSPQQTRSFLRLLIGDRINEVFGCVYVDNQHRVIDVAELFQGTIDGASVYPRVVVQEALRVNAAAVMFYHNHPSGVAEPSQADRTLTTKLAEALKLVDIKVLDHFVVSACGSFSFAEKGLL